MSRRSRLTDWHGEGCVTYRKEGAFSRVSPYVTIYGSSALQDLNYAERFETVLEAFPALKRHLGQRAGDLSGGEQQMLALGRAYLTSPGLVLVDEASMGLAPIVVDQLFKFLHDVAEKGTGLLIVEQYVQRVLDIATNVYVLNHGEISFAGTSEELLKSDVFEQYVGGD